MYELIEKLCKEKGISPTKLCVDVTGSKGNLPTWKKGNINPNSLVKIADYFDVSTDYLLGRAKNAENNATINNQVQTFQGTQINSVQSPSEQKAPDTMEEEFIAVFKHLNIMDKVAVMQFAFEKMQESA